MNIHVDLLRATAKGLEFNALPKSAAILRDAADELESMQEQLQTERIENERITDEIRQLRDFLMKYRNSLAGTDLVNFERFVGKHLPPIPSVSDNQESDQ